MSRMNIFRRLAELSSTAVLVAALAGCGKSTTPVTPGNLTQTSANQIATQIGFLALLGGTTQVPGASMMVTDGLGIAATARVRPASAQFDTTVTDSNFSWSMGVHWYDADGVEQGAYDSLTTTRVVVDAHAHGTATGEGHSMTIGSTSHLQLDGTATHQTQLTANATRADSISSSFTGPAGESSFVMTCAGAIVNVVHIKPQSEHPWPESGTATWNVHAHEVAHTPHGNAERSYMAEVAVTFNGTRYAALVVNGEYHYTLDLVTGEVTPVAV